jgi:hypothetical protein
MCHTFLFFSKKILYVVLYNDLNKNGSYVKNGAKVTMFHKSRFWLRCCLTPRSFRPPPHPPPLRHPPRPPPPPGPRPTTPLARGQFNCSSTL